VLPDPLLYVFRPDIESDSRRVLGEQGIQHRGPGEVFRRIERRFVDEVPIEVGYFVRLDVRFDVPIGPEECTFE
jgi:hypothetical protein